MSLPVAAQPPDGRVRLVYRAIGPQAPMHESFDVSAEAVRLRDAQGLLRLVYDRRTGVLQIPDSGTAGPFSGLRLHADGIARLAQDMRDITVEMAHQAAKGTAAQQALARQRWQELLAPRGPWSDLDRVRAEDERPPLGDKDTVLGHDCNRIALFAGQERIGEACVAPAQSVAGGTAVLQMLQAMAAALDRLRALTATSLPLAWPSHPLVAAARSGQLPLRVVQQTATGVRHSVQLDAVQPLAATPASRP